jgi:hypothetical protein
MRGSRGPNGEGLGGDPMSTATRPVMPLRSLSEVTAQALTRRVHAGELDPVEADAEPWARPAECLHLRGGREGW